MQILEQAIAAEKGVGNLAKALGLRQSAISNWKHRGIPRAWEMLLSIQYGDQSSRKPELPHRTTEGT